MTGVHLDARRLHPAVLRGPPSKSDAHRAVMLAEVLGLPLPAFVDEPRDVVVIRNGLAAITSGRGDVEVDCEDGGAPLRFLVGRAALQEGVRTRFVGSARLGERPHDALLAMLRAAGVSVTAGNPWPIVVQGKAPTGVPVLRVDARESSQHASSALLMAAALCRRQGRSWSVALTGGVTSAGYLALTVGWLRRTGFDVVEHGSGLEVRSVRPVRELPMVPTDWSSLGYLLLCAWRTGSVVQGVDVTAEHPDAALVGILRDVGLRLVRADDGVRVEGGPTGGVVADARRCPDLVPTLAAWACVLPGPSRFDGVGILRAKESDRLEGAMALASVVGARADLMGETLTVHPSARLPSSFHVDGARDHRRVMSAATLAVLAGVELDVTDADAVAKSFPSFWDQLARLGATATKPWSAAT